MWRNQLRAEAVRPTLHSRPLLHVWLAREDTFTTWIYTLITFFEIPGAGTYWWTQRISANTDTRIRFELWNVWNLITQLHNDSAIGHLEKTISCQAQNMDVRKDEAGSPECLHTWRRCSSGNQSRVLVRPMLEIVWFTNVSRPLRHHLNGEIHSSLSLYEGSLMLFSG